MNKQTSDNRKPYEKAPRHPGRTPDLDELINGAVQLGTGLGVSVLSGIADALDKLGENLHAARTPEEALPFAQWKRKLDGRLQSKNQSEALSLAVIGGVFAASFGIAAIVMWALSAVGPEALGVTQQEFLVFPILMACFVPMTVGFAIMGGIGIKKYRYFNRLRRYLRVARDWVCEMPVLARDSAVAPEQVQKDPQQAVAAGDFPNAVLELNGMLYLDIRRVSPETAGATARSDQEETPITDAERLQREGENFLGYLDRCSGNFDEATSSELLQMRKHCAAILGFVHNHPEQLPRIRRFQEYYLPTTRKLLDIAQGLGEADVQHAQEIRRDIAGILHTLNLAYRKLYDTLLQEVSLDVSTEIDTLETMLRQDGLTHDFESDFKKG